MDKRTETVESVILNIPFAQYLLEEYALHPYEELYVLIGVLVCERWYCANAQLLSIGVPKEWQMPTSVTDLLFPHPPWAFSAEGKIGIAVPSQQILWSPGNQSDYRALSPYALTVPMPETARSFIDCWMKQILGSWSELRHRFPRALGENPFSVAFLHNHPTVRPEYLKREELEDFEVAYDLAESPLSFEEWLRRQFQEDPQLSPDDIQFIREYATHGIGILLTGRTSDETVDPASARNALRAWQLSPDDVKEIKIAALAPAQRRGDMQHRNMQGLVTISEMVSRAGEQATRDTDFRVALVETGKPRG